MKWLKKSESKLEGKLDRVDSLKNREMIKPWFD